LGKSLLETEGYWTEVIQATSRVLAPLFVADYSSNVTWKKYKEINGSIEKVLDVAIFDVNSVAFLS